jgi:hypothetical protein
VTSEALDVWINEVMPRTLIGQTRVAKEMAVLFPIH